MPPKKKASDAKAATGGGGAGAGKKKQRGAVVKHEASVRSTSGSSSGEVPDELMCGICYDLLENARQTPCCGGLSCRECIEAAAAQTRSCPYCRAKELSADRLHPDVRMERAASCFVRPCKYDGCDYRGKRDEVKVHVAACDKRPGVLAELREAEMRWRQQRCWQLASIVAQADPAGWDAAIQRQLEPLQCRVHVVNRLDADQPRPRISESGPLWAYSSEMQALPRTRFEILSAPGLASVIKLSHIEDQPQPTTCFIIRRFAPQFARRITIPASKDNAVVVKDLLTEVQARNTVNVFLARTLGDFGLTEARAYALPKLDFWY